MTLEEGIVHAEDVAIMNHEAAKHLTDEHPTQAEKCEACAKEPEQFAEWRKELKAYREQGGDAISRQTVLDIITFEDKWLFDANGHNANTHIAFSGLESRVKALSSVTPQQRTGRWIDDEFGSKCSCCGIYTHLDKFERPMKFKCCSMCGAKMEVKE